MELEQLFCALGAFVADRDGVSSERSRTNGLEQHVREADVLCTDSDEKSTWSSKPLAFPSNTKCFHFFKWSQMLKL